MKYYLILSNIEMEYFVLRPPDCSGQSALTGERLERPRQLVLMFLFSFELDVLEIALQEQQDLVDKIFLVEIQLICINVIKK